MSAAALLRMLNKLFITSPYAYPWTGTLGKFASLLFLILLNSEVDDIYASVNDIILFYYFLFYCYSILAISLGSTQSPLHGSYTPLAWASTWPERSSVMFTSQA